MIAKNSMNRLPPFLPVLGLAIVALPSSHLQPARADDAPSYGPQLEGFDYPWPVSHHRFTSQGEVLDMAYMDVQPEKPSIYLAVDGTTALWVLLGITFALLVLGMICFTRAEYKSSAP